MTTLMKRLTLTLPLTLALVCLANDSSAADGTLQERVVSFSGSATGTVTFRVGTLGADEATSIRMDFAPDGNATLPLSVEPFATPASVTFALKYNGAALAGFSFNASQAAATYSAPAIAISGTPATVQLVASKPSGTVGQYAITLVFPGGSSGVTGDFTLDIAGLPTSTRALINVAQGTGTFKALTPTGKCEVGCPAGQVCQKPCTGCPLNQTTCPAQTACDPGEFCHPPCKDGPIIDICKKKPWICGDVYWPPKKWPWPPSPCLSCPKPWQDPVPDGWERVVLEFIPRDQGGNPLGADRAGQVRLDIKGGEPVGELFDQGDGQYLQAIQYRKGAPPRVSATIAGVAMEEFVADPTADVAAVAGKVYQTLTYVFGVFFAAALVVITILARRNAKGTVRG